MTENTKMNRQAKADESRGISRRRFLANGGPNKTYTLTFDDAWGDGVRITGPPGGSSYFTSIGELEVYYDGRGG